MIIARIGLMFLTLTVAAAIVRLFNKGMYMNISYIVVLYVAIVALTHSLVNDIKTIVKMLNS